jgi:hydroxylamine reductase
MNMFCRQCEQAVRGEGCTINGVCGKKADTAILQDLLIHGLIGIAVYGKLVQELGIRDKDADTVIIEGLFTTVTNVNFDSHKIADMIYKTYETKERIKKIFMDLYKRKEVSDVNYGLPEVANWKPSDTIEGLLEQGKKVGVMSDRNLNEDIRSLREILLYGMKGMAAYADHAYVLGRKDETVNQFFYKGLAALVDNSMSADNLTSLIMELGRVNLKCMELLDQAHTEHFGHPVPTSVLLGVKKGPAIIVSGHDLNDLEQLLKQAENKGVNVYTHGEMLPAHGYPGLKKNKHLTGHFGTAWQNQQKEFDGIPAVVLLTTNCIQEPKPSYKDRIFTTGLVEWPEVEHIKAENGRKDFAKVIQKAKELGGFGNDVIEKEILVGFGHNTVLSIADKVINAVKTKAIKHFFLIGGCDGAKPGRNYFTEFAQKTPKDCVILTVACGKFRFNRMDFGDIGGMPRLLDCGQCNDAYSAIKIASALAGAFNCGINDLPLSLILSWYEQKAVCILLTLFSLGVRNIRLGPSLPAFVSPNVLKILMEKFDIRPISIAEEDMKEILG